MNPETPTAPTPPPIASHVPEPVGLDIHDPLKWQMRVRLHIGSLSVAEAEEWMSKLRLIATMGGRMVRDEIYHRVTMRCIICESRRPLETPCAMSMIMATMSVTLLPSWNSSHPSM